MLELDWMIGCIKCLNNLQKSADGIEEFRENR